MSVSYCCCCCHHQNEEQQKIGLNKELIWDIKVKTINNKQASINKYLSWTMVVCGHTHKSGGLSPSQKTKIKMHNVLVTNENY